ncbi:MAG: DUF4340 domain-containing protein [Chloroflexi bacterium]|nr:DUF4340 domain-containing protein [Chloroflexota bacterium]MCL5076257.1 DUF4340 domain-containing protein [Chloroflexota bacterium]
MSFKTTAILLVILLVLGGFVYWLEYRPGRPQEKAQLSVFNFKVEDVNSIEVEHNGRSTVVTKKEDRWQMLKPEQVEADKWRVEGVLTRLGSLTATRVLDNPGQDLATYGLSNPQAEAKVTLTGAKREILFIGDKNPEGTAYYANLPAGDKVYLIPSQIADDLIKMVDQPPKGTPTPTPAPTSAPSPTATPPS